MALGDRIRNSLFESSPDGFCDDCLADRVGASSRQSARDSAIRLQRNPNISRRVGQCKNCGKTSKITTRFIFIEEEDEYDNVNAEYDRPPYMETMDEKQFDYWLEENRFEYGFALAIRAALRCMWYPILQHHKPDDLSLLCYRTLLLCILTATEDSDMSSNVESVLGSWRSSGHKSDIARMMNLLSSMCMSVHDNSETDTKKVAHEVVTISSLILGDTLSRKRVWDDVSIDIELLDNVGINEFLEISLFSKEISNGFATDLERSHSAYLRYNLSFIWDWFISAVRGHRPDLDFMFEICEIPNWHWAQGTRHVSELIYDMAVGRRVRDATPLAEEIIFDHDIAKLSVRPLEMLPDDLYKTVILKLHDAINDIREALEQTNSYSTILPTVRILDRTITKYADNPQRVHDDQLLAIRRLKQLVDDGDLPDNHEVRSLMQVLDTNVIDIRGAIPEVADSVKKRNSIRIQQLEDVERNTIIETANVVALQSTDSLAEQMTQDVEDTFDASRKKDDIESPYRLMSRLSRAVKIVRELEIVLNFAESQKPLVDAIRQDVSRFLEKFIGL